MTIAKWQRFDDEHSHCSQCCNVFANKDLRGGRCAGCRVQDDQRRRDQLERADDRAISRAAREILAHMQGQGKDGASMPVVMEAFYAKIGGKARLGEIFAEQFEKTLGSGLSEAQLLEFEHNPKHVLGWAELIARISLKTDEGKTLDVSGMASEDLSALLSQLAEDLVRTNDEFRRMVVKIAIETEPSLANLAMEVAGMSSVEGSAKVVEGKPKLTKPPDVNDDDDYEPEMEASID